MNLRFHSRLLMVLALGAASRVLAATAPNAEQVDFFEKQIRPILANRCYECHSVEKKTKGGLALDSRASTLKGGDTGPALVAGDPEKSLLIEAVRYKNHDLQMPPKRQLSVEEIKALEAWVKMGAPDPRTAPVVAKQGRVIDIKEGRKFWSFAPLARIAPPVVPGAASPIDAFLQTKLKEKGLSSAPLADKRTLIRRATYDLTGLPPTPKEVEDFLADTAPEAFDHVIDRLLASPHYGERWGRHWLDVARYADSNGMDENVAFGNAWRYRDYVVRAFNEDKPYDQFLIEQVAGDLLPRSNEDAITGTGFLALGAHVLAEPDMRKLEMDIIDEQIDTVGKAFMGLTLGCARCHDHKFDPIKQEDYYAMAAIFRSTRSLATDKMGAIKFWYEHSLATPAQLEEKKKFDEEVKARKAKITALATAARNEIKAGLQSHAAEYLAAAALLPENAKLEDATPVAKTAQLDANILLSCRQYLDHHAEHPVFTVWQELAPGHDVLLGRYASDYEPIFAEALTAKKGPAYDALADAKGFLALPAKDADILDAGDAGEDRRHDQRRHGIRGLKAPRPAGAHERDRYRYRADAARASAGQLSHARPAGRARFPGGQCAHVLGQSDPAPPNTAAAWKLARAMASSEHPLTARVMVENPCVWRWHFGQGIVSSTDTTSASSARNLRIRNCSTGWRAALSRAAGRSRTCTGSS